MPTGPFWHRSVEPARIDETRYKVLHLAAEHYHHGWTAEELLRQHPDLRPAQVYSALAYYYDHHPELLAQLKGSLQAVERIRPMQPFSRGELLSGVVRPGNQALCRAMAVEIQLMPEEDECHSKACSPHLRPRKSSTQ